MKSVERRLRALELMEHSEAQVPSLLEQFSGRLGRIYLAQHVGLALELGARAKDELDAADASLDPEGRAELSEQIEAARKIAKALEKYRPAEDTPLSARLALPERSGGPPGALNQGRVSGSVSAPPLADLLLSKQQKED